MAYSVDQKYGVGNLQIKKDGQLVREIYPEPERWQFDGTTLTWWDKGGQQRFVNLETGTEGTGPPR